METNKKMLVQYFPILLLVSILLTFTKQNISQDKHQYEGLWKSAHTRIIVEGDTSYEYSRMLLSIKGKHIILKNYNDYFKAMKIFSNDGLIDKENSVITFIKDGGEGTSFKLSLEKGSLIIHSGDKPKEQIVLRKLHHFQLDRKKDDIRNLLINSEIIFDFPFYDKNLKIDFEEDSTLMITNSVETYISIIDKWTLFTFENELFLYLSDYGPFAHITDLNQKGIDLIDEYEKLYEGKAFASETIIVSKPEQIEGIWEQERADEKTLQSIPESAWDLELYPKEVWEFTANQVKRYKHFRVVESPWELSENGELLLLPMLDDKRFRIMEINEETMKVERVNILGEVVGDTFLLRKSVSKQTTLRKYLKK